jgi:hypothetical protein
MDGSEWPKVAVPTGSANAENNTAIKKRKEERKKGRGKEKE